MSSSNNQSGMDDLKARLGMKGASGSPGSASSTQNVVAKPGAAPSPFGGAAPSPFGGGVAPSPFGGQGSQQVEEEESYDYVPPDISKLDYDPNQFDPELKAPVNKGKIGIAALIIVMVMIVCFVVGWLSSGISSDRKSVNRRIDMAITVEKTVQERVEKFNEYSAFYRDRSTQFGPKALEYDQKFYETVIKKYTSYNFSVDTSSDIPAEAIVLGQNADQNPLSELRAYSSGTLLLMQMLSNHVAETNADMEEINNLLNAGEGQEANAASTGVYAVRFDVDIYVAFLENAGRGNYAIDSKGIYQVKRPILNEDEIRTVWADMKTRLTQVQIQQLTQGGAKKKKGEAEDDLPNRMIYEIQARGSKPVYVFSDEIILIGRDQLLGSSSNALDRYRKRMQQIYRVMEETGKSTESLLKKLYNQAHEEKL